MVVQNNLKIGLFGYGCVGQGLHDILNSSTGFKADIVKIAVKDKTKKRRIPMSNFTYNKEDILGDEDINLIVELIDDADEAYEIVVDAMNRGKNVVTANKKMLAEHLEELVKIQEENNVSLLYEASSCASIPIIRNLEEYYDNEMLHSVRGIFNGSTNYILSQMYLITAALKRFEVEGEKTSDELFLEVAVEDAFGKIDNAFKGILENIASGMLGIPFKLLGFYVRLNPMGKTIKDNSLHRIAVSMCEDDSVRERVCSNIYMGERATQLLEATHAMQGVKVLFEKEKKEEPLTKEERKKLEEVRALQHEIITVDSFGHDDYFRRKTKKA